MNKHQELNTACKATFKKGNTEEFTSIEEASEKTGISIASIKIRCNKQGCGGKDNTFFEWLDDHTKRSYQARKSRTKGYSLELEVRDKLKELGFNTVTARGESKKIDNSKIDIIDLDKRLPVNIQCKHYANTPSYFTIRDACPDKNKPFMVAWKKSASGGELSPGTIAMIPIDFFYKLLDAYTKQNKL